MGKNDIRLKQWLSKKERYADLFNAGLFGGRQMIEPDELEATETESGISLRSKNGREIGIQRYRDMMMKAGEGAELVLYACENQEEIHYAMPVREMLYDAMSYTEQIRDKARANRKERKNQSRSKEQVDGVETNTWKNAGEFLSGIRNGEKLIPVFNLVFYYGDRKWDGPRDLHDMFQLDGENGEFLKQFLPSYQIHLVDAEELGASNLLNSDLRWILGMLQYKGDKDGLRTYFKDNSSYFSNMDQESYEVAKVLLGSEKQLKYTEKETEEKVDMCKALDDLYREGVEQGIEDVIRNMLNYQIPENNICQFVGCDLELVEKVKDEMKL